jgi:hypothetical protein
VSAARSAFEEVRDALRADAALVGDAGNSAGQARRIEAPLFSDSDPSGVELLFSGWALVLNADGTYFLSDTSGG